MRATTTCIALLLAVSVMMGQKTPTEAFRLGVLVGATNNIYNTSFVDLPGMMSCCPEFTGGSGIGPILGLQGSLPLAKQWRLTLRAAYADHSGDMTEQEFIGYALEGSGENAHVVQAASEHAIKAKLAALELTPRIEWRPFEDFGFGVHLAGDVGFYLSGSYEYAERLISPSGAVYSDSRTTTRNAVSANLNDLGVWLAAGLGVQWDVALSSQWHLTPEVAYYQGLNSIMDLGANKSWSISSLRGLITLEYAFMSGSDASAPSDQVLEPRASIQARELKDDNTEATVAIVRIDETLSTQVYPLLPFVFFDDGVSNINTNTYRNLTPAQTRVFDEHKAFTFDNTVAPSRSQVTLDVYYNLLNVVGKRMRDQFPQARLTLVGCNSTVGADKGATDVSNKRAQVVKQYLTTVWGIADNRIAIEARALPEKASKYSVAAEDRRDAEEENRRVEIQTNTPELLFPVVVRDTLREITPPRLRFRMAVNNDDQVQSWSMMAYHPFTPAQNAAKQPFMSEEGPGPLPEFVTWEKAGSQRNIPRSADPIIATLSVKDAAGRTLVAVDTLPVDLITVERKKRERIGNYEVDQFRLALFDYEETSLSDLHKSVVETFIKPSLVPSAIVDIDGYTDRKGSDSFNERLSLDRAKTVATALGLSDAEVVGHGEGTEDSPAPFTNTTPEGRLYNRTVNVTVKIPAK